jgi:hypothetical protein
MTLFLDASHPRLGGHAPRLQGDERTRVGCNMERLQPVDWRVGCDPAVFKSLISRNRCLSSASICLAERRLRAGLPAVVRERGVAFGL